MACENVWCATVSRIVSVIIPSLNSPVVSRVIQAVLAQRPPNVNLEVIVAGLEDPRNVEQAGGRYVTLGSPLTPGAARNLGARAATGDYLIFLDSDCVPEPGWLSGFQSYWEMDDDLIVVSAAIRIIPDQFWRVAGNVASFLAYTSSLPSSNRPFLASYSLALTRSAFDEVGGFDELLQRAEDLDFTIRLFRAGYQLRFDSSIAVVHLPPRTSLQSVLRHARASGRNSIRVRRRYADVFGMPRFLFHPIILSAFAPLFAIIVTARAVSKNPDARRWWSVVPVVLLSRLAWCAGAAWASLDGLL